MKTKCPVPLCDEKGQNNLMTYEDGSAYCFACGYTEAGDGSKRSTIKFTNNTKEDDLLSGTVQSLPRRGISERTCKFFDYQIGEGGVHIANYRDKENTVIGQKIRGANKKFRTTGDMKSPLLYGQWLYTQSEHVFVTVVEGEIDALSVAEACGLQYPVVSVPLGAGSAAKALKGSLNWLSGFKHVVLAFDNDEPGKEAVKECLDLFEPGKVKVAHWPLKDANEMLVAGRVGEIKNILFNAKDTYEDHLVTPMSMIDDVLRPPQLGLDFPYKSLTQMTYGFRLHELYIWVGPNSVGKTELMKEIVFNFLDQGLKVGMFSFEQRAESTIQRLIGAKLNQKLHIPGSKWDTVAIKREAMKLEDKVFVCKAAGSRSIKQICNDIRYWSKAKGVKLIVIDNIKGLCRGMKNENQEIKTAMLDFQALVQELDISIFLISHVSKDKMSMSTYVSTSPKKEEEYLSRTAEQMEEYTNKPGLSWEAGRMPTKENVEGTSTICDLADYVFALARNTVSLDPVVSSTLKVKCLKARLDGGFTGHSFKLYYGNDGRLVETSSTCTTPDINPGELFYEQ